MRLVITAIILIASSLFAPAQTIDLMPAQSQVLKGYERDSVIARMKQAPLHHIEGVWQFVDEGATIAIEKFNPDNISGVQDNFYRIVIIKSPMRAIEPGTVMGYVTSTAQRNIYDAHIYTSGGLSGLLSKPKTFTLNLSDDNLLSFKEYKTEININLWRLLPYIHRVGISVKDTRPKGLDGCFRVFPVSNKKPLNPRYL